jgi:hypothetical protein
LLDKSSLVFVLREVFISLMAAAVIRRKLSTRLWHHLFNDPYGFFEQQSDRKKRRAGKLWKSIGKVFICSIESLLCCSDNCSATANKKLLSSQSELRSLIKGLCSSDEQTGAAAHQLLLIPSAQDSGVSWQQNVSTFSCFSLDAFFFVTS